MKFPECGQRSVVLAGNDELADEDASEAGATLTESCGTVALPCRRLITDWRWFRPSRYAASSEASSASCTQ